MTQEYFGDIDYFRVNQLQWSFPKIYVYISADIFRKEQQTLALPGACRSIAFLAQIEAFSRNKAQPYTRYCEH
jgi:hypothetical protein